MASAKCIYIYRVCLLQKPIDLQLNLKPLNGISFETFKV